mgnify:CR=1 FL=1
MRDEWVRFAAATLQGLLARGLILSRLTGARAGGPIDSTHMEELAEGCALQADAMMVEYVKRFAEPEQLLLRLPEPAAEWTWGEVEIFGRRSHLGRYRWTAGERFLDVAELLIERVDGVLVERIRQHRYGAKAIFSVSARPEADIRAAATPYGGAGSAAEMENPRLRREHELENQDPDAPPSSDDPDSLPM